MVTVNDLGPEIKFIETNKLEDWMKTIALGLYKYKQAGPNLCKQILRDDFILLLYFYNIKSDIDFKEGLDMILELHNTRIKHPVFNIIYSYN